MVQENTEAGSPVMRPLFLMFEADPLAYLQDYQYMLGSDLLVAPVLAPGLNSWPVYLPGSGNITWVHLWSGDSAPGNTSLDTPAPLGQPPEYYREGSQWNDLFELIKTPFGL